MTKKIFVILLLTLLLIVMVPHSSGIESTYQPNTKNNINSGGFYPIAWIGGSLDIDTYSMFSIKGIAFHWMLTISGTVNTGYFAVNGNYVASRGDHITIIALAFPKLGVQEDNFPPINSIQFGNLVPGFLVFVTA